MNIEIITIIIIFIAGIIVGWWLPISNEREENDNKRTNRKIRNKKEQQTKYDKIRWEFHFKDRRKG